MRDRGSTASPPTSSPTTAGERRAACAAPPVSWRPLGSEDPSERTEAKIDAADRWPRVADAVGRLPPAERDTLFLYAWEGLSYEEVASSLEIPVGTVRSRINRARRRIRELEKASGEEQMKRRQSRMTR